MSEKINIILTTKGGGDFALTCTCTEDEITQHANYWVELLNQTYGGTNFEIISFRTATDDEIKNFTRLPDDLEERARKRAQKAKKRKNNPRRHTSPPGAHGARLHAPGNKQHSRTF
jgi:hypothetical protein